MGQCDEIYYPLFFQLFYIYLFVRFSTGLVQIYIAGLPLRSCVYLDLRGAANTRHSNQIECINEITYIDMTNLVLSHTNSNNMHKCRNGRKLLLLPIKSPTLSRIIQ